jgi:hypothetical protein
MSEKKLKPVKQLTDDHRTLIDPQVRQVRAMRIQTQDAGVKLDTMLTLVFPEWDTGNFVYDPESGGFFKKGAKLPKVSDPLNKPHSR